jgi:hypothetical protein
MWAVTLQSLLTAKKMRFLLKDLEIKVEAVKSEEAGTVTEEKFEIIVKINAPEDRIQRIHKLTLQNCPVGKIFENAGVKISYALKTEKEMGLTYVLAWERTSFGRASACILRFCRNEFPFLSLYLSNVQNLLWLASIPENGHSLTLQLPRQIIDLSNVFNSRLSRQINSF